MFKISARGSTVRQEIVAGLTTFLAMVYSVIVVPGMLFATFAKAPGVAGSSASATLTVTSFQAMPHPMLKKDAIGANAYTVVKRSEFNAGKYAPYVGDEVRIDLAIEAIKE